VTTTKAVTNKRCTPALVGNSHTRTQLPVELGGSGKRKHECVYNKANHILPGMLKDLSASKNWMVVENSFFE
jgi:hypothetical protein